MNEKILVVDDDFGIVRLIETVLKSYDYRPSVFTSSTDALRSFEVASYDLILSDLIMPVLDGAELLKKVREKDQYIPFIIITANSDIQNAINLLKHGVDDYLIKPVVNEELIFRIRKNIEEKMNKRVLDRIAKEKEILQLESKRLVDWKNLYADKDVKQTSDVINLFNRTFNQSGGFIWLDILKSQTEKIDEDNHKINSSLVNLIIKSTEANQLFFDNITFISNIDSIELNFNEVDYSEFSEEIYNFVLKELIPLSETYKRKVLIQNSNLLINGKLSVDMDYIKKTVKELFINALKYSPEETPIFFMIDKNTSLPGKNIDIAIKNIHKKMNAKDLAGNDIYGIPYEYSELIFDLFYTVEAFPTTLPEEEWSNGTGLFIARKMIKKHGGWLKTLNEIDYTKGTPSAYIKFVATIPYS